MAVSEKELQTTHFVTTLARDVSSYLIGDRISGGQFRDVFEYEQDPTKWVVKIENGARSFCNHYEWAVWNDLKDTPAARWLAPIKYISPNGVVMIQARTKPLKASQLPERVPAFFTDLKPSNWGMYRGRVVCHDYGHHLLLVKGATLKTRRAHWRQ